MWVCTSFSSKLALILSDAYWAGRWKVNGAKWLSQSDGVGDVRIKSRPAKGRLFLECSLCLTLLSLGIKERRVC